MPVGAVFYHIPSKAVILRSGNKTNALNNATAHCEILCIRELAERIQNEEDPTSLYFKNSVEKIMMDCCLYVTVEPCVMCAHALTLSSKSPKLLRNWEGILRMQES